MDDNEELLKQAMELKKEIEEDSRRPRSREEIAYEIALNLLKKKKKRLVDNYVIFFVE